MNYSSKLSRSAIDELDRRLKEELTNLERAAELRLAEQQDPQLRAKHEFDQLRREYGIDVADVLGFFPEDEAVAYLQSLMEPHGPGMLPGSVDT
ncbi:hypothetical protein [Dyella japonica]|uniref:Uncharacterized protein n=1 Tax=Dyella japonica TaxID=231455 RepID=A0ABV2K1W1_9GAMM